MQDKKKKATIRLRKEGGGRKKITEKYRGIITKIEGILDETTAGDPMSLLKWTSKSTYTIANTFKEEMAKVNIKPHAFHGDWNYTIKQNSFFFDRFSKNYFQMTRL